MIKKYFLTLLLYLFANGFITASEMLDPPPTFKYEKNAIAVDPATYHLVFNKDIRQLLDEDAIDFKAGYPLRIAWGTDIRLSLNRFTTTGIVLPSKEEVWQYAIQSPGAKGLIITFSEFFIPEGDVLYVYTKDRRQVTRFTHETNPSGGIYATDALAGDEIVFEYVMSDPKAPEQARIKVSNIAYIYRSLRSINQDVSCYINSNCPEGDDWQIQRKGVVRIMMQTSQGWGVCSGSLINNVREDKTPYILTAHHCVTGSEVMSTLKFDFFCEAGTPDCHVETGSSPYTKTLTGGTLIATTTINGSSDGSLLKINRSIPSSWQVYYNGWDARGIPAVKGASIHHPRGFVQKISTFTTPLVVAHNKYAKPGSPVPPDTHWQVLWSPTENGHSVTFGGSSGSPLFNENGLIVGTLTGGDSYCEFPDKPDWYGRFSYHWDQDADSIHHFKHFLDPDSTGTLVLDGYDPHYIAFQGKPEATAATNISTTGFTAHWKAFPGASSYLLNVYRKTAFAGHFTDTVDFTGKKMSAGWKKNSIVYYLQEDQCGQAAPALQLGIGGSVESPDYGEKLVKSLSFWYRGIEASPANALVVSGWSGGKWTDFKTLQPLTNTAGGATVTVLPEELPDSCTAIKIRHEQKSGAVAIDDIMLDYGTYDVLDYVRHFNRFNTGNALSWIVDGLDNNTEYYYSVIGYNGKQYSAISNEITVKTTKDPVSITRMDSPVFVYADDHSIYIHADREDRSGIFVYNIMGRLAGSAQLYAPEVRISRKGLPAGVYFVKIGHEIYKVLLK